MDQDQQAAARRYLTDEFESVELWANFVGEFPDGFADELAQQAIVTLTRRYDLTPKETPDVTRIGELVVLASMVKRDDSGLGIDLDDAGRFFVGMLAKDGYRISAASDEQTAPALSPKYGIPYTERQPVERIVRGVPGPPGMFDQFGNPVAPHTTDGGTGFEYENSTDHDTDVAKNEATAGHWFSKGDVRSHIHTWHYVPAGLERVTSCGQLAPWFYQHFDQPPTGRAGEQICPTCRRAYDLANDGVADAGPRNGFAAEVIARNAKIGGTG